MSRVLDSEPLTDEQSRKVHDPTEDRTDMFAAKIALSDYKTAEHYRMQNHDHRWRSADALYVAHAPKKTWRGTRIPRSSLGIFLVFQQVQSFLPRAMSALFAGDPWFEVGALGRTPIEAARVSQEVLLSQMEQCNMREQTRLAVQNALIYGNGILGLEWLHRERKVKRTRVEHVPKTTSVPSITGGRIRVPTGQFTRRLKEEVITETENRPIVLNRSIKDIFVDPNTPSPDIQKARYVIERWLPTIEQVMELEKKDGFKVPPKPMLLMFADQKGISEADSTKTWTEVARQGSWDPANDYTEDAAGKRVEVLKHWTRDRCVWIIRSGNAVWPLFNGPNPYGFIPFYNIVYADMPDRFYGLSISDVLEGEQRFQQASLNARVDELALSIHPPTVHRRGMNVPEHQLRQVPGALVGAEDPSKHLVRLFPSGATQQAYVEQTASEIRAQKITGLNDLVNSGAPNATNPAARTATGAGAQVQAAFARIQYFVENMETTVLETVLRDAHRMNQLFLDPNQIVASVDGRDIDPIDVFGAEVQFKMRASSRMASKLGILQVFPTVLQSLMNPMLLQQLASMGETVNFKEAVQVLLDAAGYSGRAEFFRQLTEEETQAMQQRQPSPEQIKLQMQRERMSDLEELQGQKFEQETAQKLLLESAKAAFQKSGTEGV